jgi:hypothetical protein
LLLLRLCSAFAVPNIETHCSWAFEVFYKVVYAAETCRCLFFSHDKGRLRSVRHRGRQGDSGATTVDTLLKTALIFFRGSPGSSFAKNVVENSEWRNKMKKATLAFPKVLGYLAMISGLLILSPWTAITANAQGTGPCAEDMEKFCKGVEPGGGRIYNCFNEHAKDLSPACQEHIKAMKAKVREAKKACADDVDKFCQDVKAGGGRIGKCLKQHADELSTECKEVMTKAKKKGAEMKKQEQAY